MKATVLSCLFLTATMVVAQDLQPPEPAPVPPDGFGEPQPPMMGGGMAMPGFVDFGGPGRFEIKTVQIIPEGDDKPVPFTLKLDTQTGQIWQMKLDVRTKRLTLVPIGGGQPPHFNGGRPGGGFGVMPGGGAVPPGINVFPGGVPGGVAPPPPDGPAFPQPGPNIQPGIAPRPFPNLPPRRPAPPQEGR
ncbi:MAG: hypothetical protein CMO66_04040 [Verrucomicrobiales bacterium]|nr:hypothetical protein [Verrucomicrobiales bacterium]